MAVRDAGHHVGTPPRSRPWWPAMNLNHGGGAGPTTVSLTDRAQEAPGVSVDTCRPSLAGALGGRRARRPLPYVRVDSRCPPCPASTGRRFDLQVSILSDPGHRVKRRPDSEWLHPVNGSFDGAARDGSPVRAIGHAVTVAPPAPAPLHGCAPPGPAPTSGGTGPPGPRPVRTTLLTQCRVAGTGGRGGSPPRPAAISPAQAIVRVGVQPATAIRRPDASARRRPVRRSREHPRTGSRRREAVRRGLRRGRAGRPRTAGRRGGAGTRRSRRDPAGEAATPRRSSRSVVVAAVRDRAARSRATR
jgi:hypothetical protein